MGRSGLSGPGRGDPATRPAGHRPHPPALAHQAQDLPGGARREPHQAPDPLQVEHVFALIKLKFGFSKVRYRGLAKNLHRLFSTCALVNLVTARKHLLAVSAPSCA